MGHGRQGIISSLAKSFVESHRDIFSLDPEPASEQPQATPASSFRGRPVEMTSGRNETISMDDTELAGTYQFLEEVGFGNWGSVWKCRPKGDQSLSSRIAIKLVHRTKDAVSTTRVRSLWSEYKCLRNLDPHPNIIHFHSFTITPSYALISMDLHLGIIPISLAESRARGYFSQLIDAVSFLHTHGVTHCDIKPSNIVLSSKDEPVLVDFGFSQVYERGSGFASSLSWGTPEYLSPERAAGLKHDERLSDIWALGVTIYEIVVGRTPFEESEFEQFLTEDALAVYVKRTATGRFLGSHNLSPHLEDLIHRMVEPDLALRLSPCSTALKHPFFRNTPSPPLPPLPSIITSPRPNSRKLLPTKSTSHLSVYSDRSDTSPRPDQISRKAAELLGLTEKGAGPKGTPSILSAATGIGELSHGRPSGSVTTESESEEDGEEERIDEDPARATKSTPPTSPFRSSFSSTRDYGFTRATSPRSVSFDSTHFDSPTKSDLRALSSVQEPILTPTQLRKFTSKERELRTVPSFATFRSREFSMGLTARPAPRPRYNSAASLRPVLEREKKRGAVKDVQWTVNGGLVPALPPMRPARSAARNENVPALPKRLNSRASQSSLRWNPDEFDSSSDSSSSDLGVNNSRDDDPTITIRTLALPPRPPPRSSPVATPTSSKSRVLPLRFSPPPSTRITPSKSSATTSTSTSTGTSELGSKSGRGLKWMRALGIGRREGR